MRKASVSLTNGEPASQVKKIEAPSCDHPQQLSVSLPKNVSRRAMPPSAGIT